MIAMRVWILHSLSRIAPLSLAWVAISSQAVASTKVEPGLENAVEWKWTPAPPETDEWGMKLPEKPKPGSLLAEATAAEPRPTTYEVVKGDAIVKIARKFHMTSEQLMQFNELKSSLIQIGQILRIPTPEELLAMAPPPVAIPVDEKGKEPEKPAGRPGLELPPTNVAELELQTVLVQVFLDREMFSQGPIDGDYGPMFEQMRQKYLDAHPYVSNKDELKTRALAAVDHPYTSYTLRVEDFRFIDPRKEEPLEPPPPPPPTNRKQRNQKQEKPEPPPPPPVTYDELVSASFLPYRSAWEYVAERFHCDEKFLRRINPHVDRTPIVGTVFQVPNVIPFEIEKPLELPLQPATDPLKPVTAAVVGSSFLEISRGGALIAVMPLASARPGLRGRGTWTVLDAIPRPRLITHREPRDAPITRTVANKPLPPEESLAPGPNNPVGIIWIDLAKSNNTEPLPYGLHGTSIPGEMRSQKGIGGLRLANWDIVRVVRLLPAGTPLQWKAH